MIQQAAPQSALPFSTTPAVYASFSPEAQALLEGLLHVAEDPELAIEPPLSESPLAYLPERQPLPQSA